MIPVERLHARIEDSAASVLPRMLENCAQSVPNEPFVIFDEGPQWSYAEALDLALRSANSLQNSGLARGDRVALWLPEGPEVVRLSLGVWFLGAVLIPLNPDLRGGPLEHALNYVSPEMLISTPGLLARLPKDCSGLALPEHIIAIGATSSVELACGRVAYPSDRVDPADQPLENPPDIAPWDVHTIFLTSGTTGVPKGVESTHVHTATMAADGLRFMRRGDRFMSPAAWFHIAGSYAPWAALVYQSAFVVVGRFSATRYWDQVRRNAVTVSVLIGVMSDFLLNQPEHERDSENPLRIVVQYPLQTNVSLFRARFGVEVYTQYDQTECGPAIMSDIIRDGATMPSGYCGQLRDGFSATLVDENDIPVAPGKEGQLCLRCEIPWAIATHYFEMPEETLKAWRNGWYHTGDVFRTDDDGNFYFVDRSKHVIRRRGENISSFQVEQQLTAFTGVAAAATYAVPDGHNDFELMAAIEPAPREDIDLERLHAFLRERLPQHMVPRYVRVLSALPRSASDKIAKANLVEDGLTPDSIELINREEVVALQGATE